jgi:hypothetical protein
MGDNPDTLGSKAFFQWDLVVKFKRSHFHGLHGLNGKIESDSFFDPLMYFPTAIFFLGSYPDLAGVEEADHFADRFLHTALLQQGAIIPRIFNNRL